MEAKEDIIMPEIVGYLNFVGLPRIKTKTKSAVNILIHGSTALMMLSTTIPELNFVCSDGNNIFEKIEVLLVSISVVKVLLKILIRVFTIEKFWKLFDELQYLYANEKDQEKMEILKKKTKEARIITKATVITYTTLCCSFFLVNILMILWYRLTGHPKEFQLPRTAQYNFDTSKNPVFIIIFVSQLLSAFMCIQCAVWDSLFFSCSNYVLAQVEFLVIDFSSLCKDEKKSPENKTFANQTRATNPNTCIENDLAAGSNSDLYDLQKCIQNHIMVIALVRKLEDLFGLQIAIECTASGIIGCLSIFQATHTPEYMVMLSRCMLAIFTYSSLYVLFYYGQKIFDESSRLTEIVYALPWQRCGVRYARSVALVLHQVQQPLVVTGSHFYTIQRETFLSLIRGSYSYFTLLRTMTEN